MKSLNFIYYLERWLPGLNKAKSYTEANTGAARTYGTNNNDMGITAIGNINKTPGLGLTQGGQDYDDKYGTYLKLVLWRDD